MAVATGDMEWNIDMEVNLFHAMRGHKPAGVNRHFQMIAIHDKLSSSTKKVTSNDVWKHLSTLYDLQALYESEIVPFPNKSGDFALPDREMLDMCTKSFPRSAYINSAPSEHMKSEASGKTISKFSTKQDSKLGSQTPKIEGKSEHKSSSSKSDSRLNTPTSRSESKSSQHNSSLTTNSSKSSHQNTPTSIPSPSPKRTKRTRNVNSASASPATPTEPQSKRRR